MAILEEPEFLFLADFAKRIYAEGHHGPERKRLLAQLKEWQHQNRMAMNANTNAKIEKRRVLDEVFELAIKMTAYSFIPPWNR
ncbi:MAG: hypothetical protein C5B47_00900 [Verrucomicrobia bacterium]|nr:MAG: hypothetical protein C5B47_00900 [Verrucomicrobiota bacterium]